MKQSEQSELSELVEFYLKRISYYDGILNDASVTGCTECVRGYGDIVFFLNQDGVKHMRQFWKEALIEQIGIHTRKQLKNSS